MAPPPPGKLVEFSAIRVNAVASAAANDLLRFRDIAWLDGNEETKHQRLLEEIRAFWSIEMDEQ